MSERDQTQVIETQQNRICYLQNEVAQLEQKLTRLAKGPGLYQQWSFEAAMEDRFPTKQRAAELARVTEIRLERAASPSKEVLTREPIRQSPTAEASIAK